MFRHQMFHRQGICFVTLLNYISTIAPVGACRSLIIFLYLFIVTVLSLVELQIIKNATYMFYSNIKNTFWKFFHIGWTNNTHNPSRD